MLFDLKSYRQFLYPLWKQKKLLRGNPPELDPPSTGFFMSEGVKKSVYWITIGIVMFLMLRGCAFAYTQEDTIKAVIGEAEGESQEGKEAVACAIHYRGSLKGVYGLRASRVINHKYSLKTYKQARQAVEIADDREYCEGLINGAQYWEGTYFPTPYWAKSMTLTAVIGHQRFYRKDS